MVFLSGAPLLLAYAWGYRASSLTPRESLVPAGPSVGAMVVRTTPRGARVLLDGRVVDERTPAGVSAIPRGTHLVRIEKPEYRPYEKRLDVRGGQVTDLLHVRLIPETVEEEIIRREVSGVWASPDERWIVLGEGSTLGILPRRALPALSPEIAAGDLGGFEVRLPPHRSGRLVFFWGPNGNAVAVGVQRTDETEDAASPPESLALVDLSNSRLRALPARTRLVGWAPSGPERVLLLNAEGALLGLPTQETKPEVIATGILAAAIHPRGVLVQRAVAESGEAPFGLLRNGAEFQALPPAFPESARVFHVSPAGMLAGLSNDGTLWVLSVEDQTWRTLAENVRRFAWSPDGNKLLYQESAFDVSVVNVSEDRSVLEKLRPEFLVRLSLPLRNLQWFPDSQHLLYFDQDVLRLVDIDPRGGRRAENLISVDRGDPLATVLEDSALMLVTARREVPTRASASGRTTDVLLRLFLRTPDDR